jgi:hypothetical protein
MSRQVYLLGLGLALVALAFLLTEALLWRPGVTRANVRRVREGMTFREVQALLGDRPISLNWPTPAEMFGSGSVRALAFEPGPEVEPQPAEGRWLWSSDEDGATAIVRFDSRIRVRGKVEYQQPDPELWAVMRTWCGQKAPQPDLGARLRSWLGR